MIAIPSFLMVTIVYQSGGRGCLRCCIYIIDRYELQRYQVKYDSHVFFLFGGGGGWGGVTVACMIVICLNFELLDGRPTAREAGDVKSLDGRIEREVWT